METNICVSDCRRHSGGLVGRRELCGRQRFGDWIWNICIGRAISAKKACGLELGAYKCHVFLDWRNLQEDPNHPWGALCDMLGGRGVSSLADAIQGLQLKPVHDSLRGVLDPSIAESLAKPAEKPKTVTAESDVAADSDKLSQLTERVRAFLEQARLS